MRFLSQVDLSKIPVKGWVPESSATPPADPATFQLWGDTSTNRVRWYVPGRGWVALDDVADGAVTADKLPDGELPLSKLATDPLDRANHTGTQPASTISDLAETVQAYRLDEFAAPAAPLNAGGQRITNAAPGVAPTDVVTVQQLHDARAGLAGVKTPVRVAATENVNLAAPGATIDGVTMHPGDRFLATAQTTGTENGIYVYNGPDTPATRAEDADDAGEILDGTIVAVAEGTSAGMQYIQQATPSGAPGNWVQTWTVYSTGGTTYIPGPGLELDGNAFAVKPGDSSIVVDSSGVRVGTVSIAQGGTGATTAAAARANLGAPGKWAGDAPALPAGTWTAVTHNLGTEDVAVGVRENATGESAAIRWRVAGPNTVELHPDVAVAAGALRVVVVG